jgi:GAF domain-containing protein
VPDVRLDPRVIEFAGAGIQTLSELCVPIFLGQETVGVINLESDRVNAFSEDDLQLLVTLSNNVAIYVQRARLFEEARVRASELAVLNEMSQQLSGALDINQACQHIYHYSAQLLGIQDLYIALYEDEIDTVHFPLAVEKGQQLSWDSRQSGEGMTEYVIKTREPLLIQQDVYDALDERGIQQIGAEAHAWLGVPMMVGERAMGMIAAQSFDPSVSFSDRHQDLMTSIANQAALTIQSVRLFQQTQARARREQTLREVTSRVTRTPNVDTVMQAAVQEIGRVLGRQAFIYLDDPDNLGDPQNGNGKEA